MMQAEMGLLVIKIGYQMVIKIVVMISSKLLMDQLVKLPAFINH